MQMGDFSKTRTGFAKNIFGGKYGPCKGEWVPEIKAFSDQMSGEMD